MTVSNSGIGSWPDENRPRERLLSRGAQALTDAELVAILIRVGVEGTNAVEMARQLIARFGSLRGLAEAPVIALLETKGLKVAKVAQLVAAMELARRVYVSGECARPQMKSTTMVTNYLRERMRGLAEEHFRVLYLNRRNELLEDALIAHGSVDAVRAPLRDILARALRVNASALIAAHNHPSGAAEPSESDRMVTQDLIAACHALRLKLLDHVIIGDVATYSFADSGLLSELELFCIPIVAPGRYARTSRNSR